jgi:hypothetical protein
MNMSINLMSRNKVTLVMLSITLIVSGISAQAEGILNSETGGYLVCVNSKTKVLTHLGKTICPKGSTKLVLGAKGSPGITGAIGLSGKDGRDGKDGKTLWNGVKDPENSWGEPGDIYFNSATKTLFGPKGIDGTWPAGVSLVGPQGERGLIGLTGAMGPQGPGGSGPAGAQGPTGATGPAGANGTNGTDATLTCAQGGTCLLGDTGPGGGKVFYITPTPNSAATPWRYLEAAPNTWNGGSEDPALKFCSSKAAGYILANPGTGTSTASSTSKLLGRGFYNSKVVLNDCSFGAAHLASAYHGGGKSDWFLPSKDELNELFLASSHVSGFTLTDHYWSSSEAASDDAAGSSWVQIFDGGSFFNDAWGNTNLVRPIRAF